MYPSNYERLCLVSVNAITIMYLLVLGFRAMTRPVRGEEVSKKRRTAASDTCISANDNGVCGDDFQMYPNACTAREYGINRFQPARYCKNTKI